MTIQWPIVRALCYLGANHAISASVVAKTSNPKLFLPLGEVGGRSFTVSSILLAREKCMVKRSRRSVLRDS